MEIKEMKKISKQIRKDILELIYHAKSGHPGGSLSIADILTVLYYNEMNIDPKKPKMENRDRLILSKGHAAPALYATLMSKGYIGREHITTLRKYGSILQGHPDIKKTPGVEMSTGSLGQGLSVANGLALNSKIFGPDYRVYTILGDGEIQEGQIWEAAMTSGFRKLDNLVAILDYNNLQIDGDVRKVKDVYPVVDKFKAFRWNVIEIDGHNYEEILLALEEARKTKGKPTIIVAHTIKGKGVSFMENNPGWHGKAPNKEEYEKAIKELDKED